jgi:hypothetical protein
MTIYATLEHEFLLNAFDSFFAFLSFSLSLFLSFSLSFYSILDIWFWSFGVVCMMEDEKKELEDRILKQSRGDLGQVVCFEICGVVQEFLEEIEDKAEIETQQQAKVVRKESDHSEEEEKAVIEKEKEDMERMLNRRHGILSVMTRVLSYDESRGDTPSKRKLHDYDYLDSSEDEEDKDDDEDDRSDEDGMSDGIDLCFHSEASDDDEDDEDGMMNPSLNTFMEGFKTAEFKETGPFATPKRKRVSLRCDIYPSMAIENSITGFVVY